MAKNNVFTNGMSIVGKNSGGKSTAFPDVCKTPTPGGPVPVPYPNISKSSDLANGSITVKIEGASVCLKGSNFSTSTGNEAGSAGGGLASGKTKGIAEPINYSFNVKIEGRNVVRNLDQFLNNNKNTPPVPIIQNQGVAATAAVTSASAAATVEEEEACDYCGKPKNECKLHTNNKTGNHEGNGTILFARILDGKNKEDHPWYTGPFSVQAHHIICSETMREKSDPDWSKYCKEFGYDINNKNNGVILPYKMESACQIHVPLHRGGHAKGLANDIHLPYPDAVKQKIDEIKQAIESGEFCSDPAKMIDDLNDLSDEILGNIDNFTWTITSDGKDYMPNGNGCGNQTSITAEKTEPCSCQRNHQIEHFKTKQILPVKSGPLKTGE